MELVKIILICFIILFSCCDKFDTKKIIKNTKVKQNQELLPVIINFELTHTEHGQPKWKIKAKKAVVDQKKNILTISDGYLKLFENRVSVADMKFELAQYDTKNEVINFFGKNLITTVENEKIITYDIKYIHRENKIYSEKEIEIYKEGNIIKGIGFETFDGFQTIRIYKNVIEPQ